MDGTGPFNKDLVVGTVPLLDGTLMRVHQLIPYWTEFVFSFFLLNRGVNWIWAMAILKVSLGFQGACGYSGHRLVDPANHNGY